MQINTAINEKKEALMYSIFTISNLHMPFLDILLNSTYRNSNVNKINNFYILDLGLLMNIRNILTVISMLQSFLITKTLALKA